MDLDGDGGLVILVCDPEREMLNVALNVFVREFASNQSPTMMLARSSVDRKLVWGYLLGIENGSDWVLYEIPWSVQAFT